VIFVSPLFFTIEHFFRHGLGYAPQWWDGLRVLVEKKVEDIIDI